MHSQAEQRFRCSLCGRTFSFRAGTLFFRCRTDPQVIVQVLTLLAYGCPIPAIEAAFGFQRRTVRSWLAAAGSHAERLHTELVEGERSLGQVQADEICVKLQRKRSWLAMAVAVEFRLWLGAVVGEQREKGLLRALAMRVRACLKEGPLLVCVDGLRGYAQAFRWALCTQVTTPRGGRPRRVAWRELVIGQVIKRREQHRLVEVSRKIVQGTAAAAKRLLVSTQQQGVINTAYIERLNATFRARLAVLGRRTRSLARQPQALRRAVYFLGAVYNFCSEHASLTLPSGQRRTPAMAAGITDHCWSMGELLWHRVAPPPWTPPKRRGRPSKALKELLHRWAT